MRKTWATARSRRGFGRFAVLVGAGAVATLTVLVATASSDIVRNDIANNGPGNTAFTQGDPVVVDYWIVANGAGGDAGCDAADGTPAVLTIPAVAGVNMSTSTLTFTHCDTPQQVTFTTDTADTYQIPAVTVSDAGPSSYAAGDTGFQIKWDPKQGSGSGSGTGNDPPPPTATAPTAHAGGPYGGNEGSPIALDASTSTGTGPLSYLWSADTTGIDAGGSCSFSDNTSATPTITCTDDGNFTVSVKVTNAQGNDSASAALAVSNVAPTVSGLTGDASVSEDGLATHHYTYTVSDPGSNDTATVAASCGGADGATISNESLGSFYCTFPDGELPAGTSTVSAQATDDDGAAGNTATADVTVNNVNPTVSALSASASTSNACTVSIASVGFSDPGAGYDFNATDPGSGSISWGDTSSSSFGPITSYAPPFLGPFSHTYSYGANWTIGATVTDGDGGANAATTTSINNTATVPGGLNPPIMAGKTFKTGSTIPVKLTVNGCAGGESAKITVNGSSTVKPSGKANFQDNLRYTSVLPGFIYNLSTNGYALGYYDIVVTLSGYVGATAAATIQITK